MTYISKRQLERHGEPIGDISSRLPDGRRMYHGGGKGGSSAPDYGPMAAASSEAAKLGSALGAQQMTDARRQYGLNMTVAAPVLDTMAAQQELNTQMGVQDRNFYDATAKPILQGMYNEMLGNTDDIKYYDYEANKPYEYDPNAKGAAQTAVESYLSDPSQFGVQEGVPRVKGGKVVYDYADGSTGANSQQSETDTAAAATAAPYKLAANQIIDDQFFSGGQRYTTSSEVVLDAAGNRQPVMVLRSANGQVVGAINQDGRVLSSFKDETGTKKYTSNATVTNNYLNAQQTGDSPVTTTAGGNPTFKVGGAIGKYDGDRYFAGGKAYYVTTDDAGRPAMYDAAGRQIAGYVTDKKGNATFTGNTTLMQQALSDRRHYDQQAAVQQAADEAAAEAATTTEARNNAYAAAETQKAAGIAARERRYSWSDQQKKGLESAASDAQADIQSGLATQRDATTRQLRGMGMNMSSPAAIAALAGFTRNAGLVQASGMNNARTQAKATDWNKRAQLAGIAPTMQQSASQFNVSNQSGQGVPSGMNQGSGLLLNGLNAGAGTTMQGQGQRIQGLGSILSSQTSIFNSSNSGDNGMMGLIGSGIGAAATIY